VSRLSRQCGILNISQTPRPVTGTVLLFFFIFSVGNVKLYALLFIYLFSIKCPCISLFQSFESFPDSHEPYSAQCFLNINRHTMCFNIQKLCTLPGYVYVYRIILTKPIIYLDIFTGWSLYGKYSSLSTGRPPPWSSGQSSLYFTLYFPK
jgi:hypothetical protein